MGRHTVTILKLLVLFFLLPLSGNNLNILFGEQPAGKLIRSVSRAKCTLAVHCPCRATDAISRHIATFHVKVAGLVPSRRSPKHCARVPSHRAALCGPPRVPEGRGWDAALRWGKKKKRRKKKKKKRGEKKGEKKETSHAHTAAVSTPAIPVKFS